MTSSLQKYVKGSNIPGFFWGTDYYPDSTAPDDTSLTSISGLKHIQFRRGTGGPPITVEATQATRTIDGVSHAGLSVSAANMAATLTLVGKWFWRFEVDLVGDSLPCYSEWQPIIVYE